MTTATETRAPRAALAGPWGLTGAIAALVGSFAGFYIGAQILYAVDPWLYKHDQLAFGVISEQFLGISVAAIAFYFGFVRYRVGAAGLGFRFPGWRPLAAAVATIPLIFLGIYVLIEFFSALFPQFGLQGNAKQELVPNGEHAGSIERAIVFLWASIEAPLIEETLFRSLVYQGLRTFFARWLAPAAAIGAGALASGLTFGAVHFEPHTLPILAFVGIVLALVFQYARSIYASFLVHGIFNFLAVYSVFH
jgi:membrane protease YdiL (CAAX protease family)